MPAVLDASPAPHERDHVYLITRHLPVEVAKFVKGAGLANHVQNQTTCFPHMVIRQCKTGYVNVVYEVFCKDNSF